VLLIWGEGDAKFASLGQRLAAAIGADAQTSALVDVGHAAHLEAPDACAALIRGWAARALDLRG